MDENNVIDAEFQDLAGDPINDIEPEFMESPEPIPQETEESAPAQEPPSKLDKLADFLGTWGAAIMLTFIAAAGLAFFFSFIPTISFSFSLVIRVWAGIWSIMLVKGTLANKTF